MSVNIHKKSSLDKSNHYFYIDQDKNSDQLSFESMTKL